MINIKFKKLHIEGFQSLAEANIDFDNLGICYIQGVNNYDEKSKSNGAGKSSLCESILWALYGKTSKSITNDVLNKNYVDNGCCVELLFVINGINYLIRRTIKHKKYKTILQVFKEDEDISARNKTDTDKVIRDILTIDLETFCQFIFLSQGFNTRFALYTPKMRRELLEMLYISNNDIGDFVNDIKMKLANNSAKIQTETSNKTQCEVNIQTSTNSISFYENQIAKCEEEIRNLANSNFGISKETIDALAAKLDRTHENNLSLDSKIDEIEKEIYKVNTQVDETNKQISTSKRKINELMSSKVCPMCGTQLKSDDDLKPHIAELEKQIEDLTEKVKALVQSKAVLVDEKEKYDDKLCNGLQVKEKINTKLKNLSMQYNIQESAQEKTQKLKADIEDYTKQIETLTNNIHSEETRIQEIGNTIAELNEINDIGNHIVRLTNNQFKTYLLNGIIQYLNNKLAEISTLLFSEAVISIDGDSKLEINLGDKLYEQLSGGEQRKVDIALVLAQRLLAQELHSISSNVIIFDEIFDNLDDVAFSIILNVILDSINDVESMFIISHRNINEIPFDRIITITKEKNQLSHLSFE